MARGGAVPHRHARLRERPDHHPGPGLRHKLAGLTTSTVGSGTATITIPAATKPGTYKIYAVGSNSKPTVTATITVT